MRNEAKVSVKEEEEIDGLPLSLSPSLYPSITRIPAKWEKELSMFFAGECTEGPYEGGKERVAGMIDAERRGNRRCANKRQERGTERRPTKTECGRQTKGGGREGEGRFDGSAGKSLKRENKRGLDWTAREKERMEGECWGV